MEVEKLYEVIQANYYDPVAVGKLYTEPTATQMSFATYAHGQAWMIPTPAKYNYTLWQPWVKTYDGCNLVTYGCSWDYTKFVWIDQELKKSMGR